MGLEDYLDVDPESSAGEDDGSLEAAPLDQGDNPDPAADAPKGRTVENVYAEMARKTGKLENELARLTGMIETLASRPAAPAQAQPSNPQEVSSAQLEAARSTISEEEMPRFEALLQQTKMREMLDSRLAEHTQSMQITNERNRANDLAKQRFPELNDRGSEFYRKVDERIRAAGESYVTHNPRAVLDIANDVALSEGIVPNVSRSPQGRLASRANAAPKREKQKKATTPIDRDEAAKIAKRMEHAMPEGKEFNLDRVMEKMAVVQENIGLFGGGNV